jgi:phage terminase small subunit
MARARSPNRDKAETIWLDSKGQTPLIEIAAALGVSDSQIRKWKNQDKWEDKLNGNVTKSIEPKGNVTKRISPGVKAVFTAADNQELTEKEQLFCRFFVNNRNATQAAIKAGYSVKTARFIGYELLTKLHIKAEVERLKAIRNEAIMLSEDDIVERQMRIAFADMTDFSEFGTEDVPITDPYGKPLMNDDGSMKTYKRSYLNFKSHDQVDGGLICEISVGKSGMKVKLEDRQKALDWLADYFNMNPLHKHKQWFDKERLDIERKKLAIVEAKAGGGGEDIPDDGFLRALEAKGASVWEGEKP